MATEFLVGGLLTLAALGGMVAWAYHEVLRVDEVTESVDERLLRDKDQDEVVAERVDGRVPEDRRPEERKLV